MAAARLSRRADQVGTRVQLGRVRLHPADRIVDVGERGRVAIARMAEVDRCDSEASARKAFGIDLALVQIAVAPGATMYFYHRGERASTLRLEQPRHEPPVAVAKILD